jgi:hypothetical protein
MGVALTGGGATVACGGVTEGPIATDGGSDDAAYPYIDAGGSDTYAQISYPVDAYPTIHSDAYAHIGITVDAGDAGYPMIGIDTGADH